MSHQISTIEIPPGSEIAQRMVGAYFQDSYEFSLDSASPSALQLYLQLVKETPAWVSLLMSLRNRVVGLVGLKNLGHLDDVARNKAASDYRVGQRVGIFSLLYLSEQEIILGDSDKHLNVQVSLYKQEHGQSAAISTVVHIHNRLGRLYMMLVTPVHQLIVPAMLKRRQ